MWRICISIVSFIALVFTCIDGNSKEVVATFEGVNFESSYALLNKIYDHLGPMTKPGRETRYFEEEMGRILVATGAEGYFKGYHGYPNYCSTSINNEVVHTLPSKRKLVSGDILKLQIGLKYKGAYAFRAWSFAVGEINKRDTYLLHVARSSLAKGIEAVRSGATVEKLSKNMDATIRSSGFFPNRDYVGYQMGEKPVMPPQIPCSYTPGEGAEDFIQSGMILCILVIAHDGNPALVVARDGWNVTTRDGSKSAMFSQMVRVTENGSIPLTDASLR